MIFFPIAITVLFIIGACVAIYAICNSVKSKHRTDAIMEEYMNHSEKLRLVIEEVRKHNAYNIAELD